MEEQIGISSGCLSASFKTERDCLAAYEEMRNNQRDTCVVKRWAKDITFRIKADSTEQLKQFAMDMYERLKPLDGFREAELEFQHKVILA
jgi:hypothetical protein